MSKRNYETVFILTPVSVLIVQIEGLRRTKFVNLFKRRGADVVKC